MPAPPPRAPTAALLSSLNIVISDVSPVSGADDMDLDLPDPTPSATWHERSVVERDSEQGAEATIAKTELERRMERQQTSFAYSTAEIRERLRHLRGVRAALRRA